MTPHPTNNWSDSLQQQTREAIEKMPLTLDGNLHFKHPTLGYAFVALDDQISNRLVLRSKTGGEDHRFEGVETLLDAGWALD